MAIFNFSGDDSRGSGRKYRAFQEEYSAPRTPQKHRSRRDAIAWGRLAATLGWDLEIDLPNEVEPEYHDVARKFYHLTLSRRRAA